MKNIALAAALLLTLGAGHASAGIIFASGAGVGDVVVPVAGSTVEIGVHNQWQANNPDDSGAVWVSYAETGVDGNVVPAPNSTVPVMSIEHTVNFGLGNSIMLKVWADDTAGVWFNGLEVKTPNTTQNVCADGPIGCQPNEFASFNFAATGQMGGDVIKIDVYQIGTGTTNELNPFGVLYYASVPDGGATLTLLGGALMGLGLLRRKFNI